jgi:hypothetical protein
MPRRKRERDDAALKPVPAEILDEFVADGLLTAPDIEAAMRRFKKALIERALGAELTHHLGYPAGEPSADDTGNKRNGRTPKSILTDDDVVDIDVPRDRAGSFEPVLIRISSPYPVAVRGGRTLGDGLCAWSQHRRREAHDVGQDVHEPAEIKA